MIKLGVKTKMEREKLHNSVQHSEAKQPWICRLSLPMM